MENKQWTFKVPGNPDSKEIIVDTKAIRSVYDLLDMLRAAEPQTPVSRISTANGDNSTMPDTKEPESALR